MNRYQRNISKRTETITGLPDYTSETADEVLKFFLSETNYRFALIQDGNKYWSNQDYYNLLTGASQ